MRIVFLLKIVEILLLASSSPPPPLPNIPFMPIIDDTHESGVLQGFPKTILKGVEGGSTQINQQILHCKYLQ
jgi:hypothetical protein